MRADTNPLGMLIVSSSQKAAGYIEEMLPAGCFKPIKIVGSGSEARRLLIDNSFDIVIINTPLCDEFGHELAIDISENVGTGVLLMVKNEIYDEICSRVDGTGIMVSARPVGRTMFYQTVNLLRCAVVSVHRQTEEKKRLEAKLEEVRIVARAKCVLMENMKIGEEEAHRYIEKQSMNNRKTRREFSEDIIRLYK
ncbi:MAG: ANTAR domain-containing response regulator [Eubacteriales bacterium]